MNYVKIRDLNPYRNKMVAVGGKDRYIEYKNLFLNNVSILVKSTNKPLDYVTESLIKNLLFECGFIGYDKTTKQWARISKLGKPDKNGNPTECTFFLGDGTEIEYDVSYKNEEDGTYIINAFTDPYALASLVKDAIAEIDEYHNAKIQNMKACRTPYIIKVKNKDVRLSLEHAIEQQQDGNAVVIVDEALGDNLENVELKVPFIADKYDALEDKAKDKLLNKLGIMTANINKKERVQVGEVNATLGQCLDYIYSLIDNFNKQCDTYGIDLRMEDNTSLDEYESKDADNTAKEGNNNEEQD